MFSCYWDLLPETALRATAELCAQRSLSLSVRTPPFLFFWFSVCMLHLYSLHSLLTEVGTLPSAGASSRCSLFPPLPPLLISLPSFALPVCTRLCLIFFLFPSHSFPVSQWQQLREAAVCASASLLPQVKTAALLDAVNSDEEEEGGVGEHLLLHLQVLIPARGTHF